MADFSGSGVRDLPATSSDSLQHGDPRVLGFLQEWIEEGEAINRQDPSYDLMERAQAYIVGEQLTTDQKKLKYLPQVTVNEVRKSIQAHVSTLTDLKPLAGWRSAPEYQVQANLLNQYLLYEWVTFMLDLDLGDCIKYALAGGTGDLVVDWDPHRAGGGGHQFSARDSRDTLPLRPGYSRSIQDWEGLCLREEMTVNALKGMYPDKAYLFRPSSDTTLGRIMGKFRSGVSKLLSPMDPLDSIGQPASMARRKRSGGIVLYRAYFRDRTKNLTNKPIPMGRPGTNWGYVAAPGEPLYPRRRLVVATDTVLLYDGPNSYWHGMFPACRLKLWSVPWQFLGVPLMNDLLPMQDAINDTYNDIRLGIRQWLDPDIIYNRNAVSEATMRTLDPRRPGKRVKVTPGFGEPYAKQDGPNPQILAQAVAFLETSTQKFSDLSGTANLSALLQLRQLPSADTIQKYYEALTPEIRQEARQVEAFLRDLSEMVKVNYFQFLSTAKRVQVLGVGGEALSDFDYDPHTLVPGMKPSDENYQEQLDPSLYTRDQRAQWFHKQFVFIVAPNSVLAMNAQEQKMLRLQLARMGYYDFWSLHETLETPNVGSPPALPLPPISAPPAGVLQGMMQQVAQITSQMAATMGGDAGAAQAAGGMMGQMPAPPQYTDVDTGRVFTLDPMSGQLLEIRIPTTVTERLQAQAMMGIGQVANPAGRKASGEAPPKQETKTDGSGESRSTITESDK